jgi:hypothetical protein
VKSEAIELLEKSYDTTILILLEFKPFLEKQKIKELSNKDGRTVAQFFMDKRRELKRSRSSIPKEIIGTIENYVASRLHVLESGKKIPVDTLLAGMMTELSMKKHKLEAPFKGLKSVDITPNDSILSLVVLGTLIPNDVNAKHLASALIHQFKENKWFIFVTTDETEILAKEKELFDIFTLQCSSPQWANDYYQTMTRLKAPIENFREIQTHSEKQKEFADIMEKKVGIRIVV